MNRIIKYIGIAAIITGLLLFVVHLVIHFNGNALLFSGLALVLGGTVAFVKGEGLSSFESQDERKTER